MYNRQQLFPRNSLKDMTDIARLAKQLELSIAEGDVVSAQQLSERLGKLKARLLIEQRTIDPGEPDNEITIRLYLEDKQSTGICMPLKVRTSDTIAQLKRKMMIKYSFPEEVQRWIIGKRIPNDDESLYRCNVRVNNTAVFLYLMSCQSVGLTRDEFEHQQRELQQQNTSQFGSDHQSLDLVPNDPIQGTSPASITSITPATTPSGASSTRDSVPEVKPELVWWQCVACTYKNLPTRPGCEICGKDRPTGYRVPADYVVTESEGRRLRQERQHDDQVRQTEKEQHMQSMINYQSILATDHPSVITNSEQITCPICFEDVEIGEGVVLRECLHNFCRDCLSGSIEHSEGAVVRCPFQDNVYTCNQLLQEREIKALVTAEIYEKYLQRGLVTAEGQATNSYHCKETDCLGWCIYEDEVNFFHCQVCGKINCLTCKAIHEGVNCMEYQDAIKQNSRINLEARQTQEMLNALLASGEAMKCPKCGIVLQKKEGCDWLKCSICDTHICWVTRGPRWGPKGPGDVSGGCQCQKKKCHRNCQNCH